MKLPPVPEILILSKEGKWWQAQNEGRTIYSNTKRSGVVGWLLVSGYVDTGDGEHFRHQSLFDEDKSDPVLVDFADTIDLFIQERFKALQKEVKRD